MNAKLYRFYNPPTLTLGTFLGTWLPHPVFILEKPWLNNVPFHSCIPDDTYVVKWKWSRKYKRFTWRVMNVPNRAGILFHPGNYVHDSLGCLLPGLSYGLNKYHDISVWNSASATSLIEGDLSRENPSDSHFTLEIKTLK